jgi:hypothetical protein
MNLRPLFGLVAIIMNAPSHPYAESMGWLGQSLAGNRPLGPQAKPIVALLPFRFHWREPDRLRFLVIPISSGGRFAN